MPVPVWIPLGPWWDERAPPWAQTRRDIIVERVRARGAIVYEAVLDPNTLTTIQSPDRSFASSAGRSPTSARLPGNARASSRRPEMKSSSTRGCMVSLARSSFRGPAWLLFGSAGCGLFVVAFGWEFCH